MSENITFSGCKHLDFDGHYIARKQILGSGQVFWLRSVNSNFPAMVQFCKLRGRLNSPTACICADNAKCNDFEEITHTVEVPNP